MKRVKTSERLPKIKGEIYFVYKKQIKPDCTDKTIRIFDDNNMSEWINGNIEYWLDESKPAWFVKPEITDTDRMNWLDNNLHIDTINDLGNFECENGTYINKLREFIDNKINNNVAWNY